MMQKNLVGKFKLFKKCAAASFSDTHIETFRAIINWQEMECTVYMYSLSMSMMLPLLIKVYLYCHDAITATLLALATLLNRTKYKRSHLFCITQ